MVVATEGIDAAGKKTAVKLLKERFEKLGTFQKVETFDFPHYESIAGGLVGRILRGETLVHPDEITIADALDLKAHWSRDKALVIQSVMLADRCEHYPLLAEYIDDSSKLLILDRYYMSGIVYGQVDGLDRAWLEAIHAVLPQPQLYFLLDIPVEESVRRRPERLDYYEKNLPKLRAVRELYLKEFFSRSSRSHRIRERSYVAIPADRPPAEIVEDLVTVIQGQLAKMLAASWEPR